MEDLGFPWWIRGTHLLNIIFMSFLIRSGIQILASHPKLYWNDACKHGSEWLSFTTKKMPKDKLWTSQDEEEYYNSVVAMPGGDSLGPGRQWYFLNVIFWILTGVVYVTLLFLDWPQWTRLVPTSWEIIPGAFQNFVTYLSFQIPPIPPGEEYNYLQKLTYGAVVFLLAPFQIITGAAMSPALSARYPWFIKLLGGHQSARSLHFLGLVAWIAFVAIHVFMVIVHGFGHEMAKMIFGEPVDREAAIVITVVALVALVALHIVTTKFSLNYPRRAQHALLTIVSSLRRFLLRRVTSSQDYNITDISPQPRVNGRPPAGEEYKRMAEDGFEDYRLDVYGLVEKPRSFSLEELRTFPSVQTQRTLHHCIQGWTYVAEWTGVPLRQIIELCEPKPELVTLSSAPSRTCRRASPSPRASATSTGP